MRVFLIALLLWSVVAVVWLVVVPADTSGLLTCMHLVGRSNACEAQQNAVNQVWWDYRTMPTLLTFAAGYVGIVVIRLARVRRGPRRDSTS
jgi:hypothetical protein